MLVALRWFLIGSHSYARGCVQVELPADVAAMFCINLAGRRWSVSLGMLLCGLAMVASAAAPGLVIMSVHQCPDGHQANVVIMSGHQLMSSSAADGWVQVATFLVGRLFATYCMAAGFQYTVAKNLKLGDIS